MDINEMTLTDFKALPELHWQGWEEIDSLVILPDRIDKSTGFAEFYLVPCLGRDPLGKVETYDLFDLYKIPHVSIDVLGKSKLVRLRLHKHYILDNVRSSIVEGK